MKDKIIPLGKMKIKNNIKVFKCPICESSMEIVEYNSLRCKKNHCFDLSKNGYINFLLHNVKTEYNRSMLESRNIICKSGFFTPLIKKISEIITLQQIKSSNKINILDIGCGEGSHLSQIIENISNGSISYEGIGIDISKDGIHIASREYKECIWCVGDLTKNPFKNQSFDIILDVLSPSNYAEFNRILKKNGLLIKVVPGSNYLRELRDAFYNETEKETYSNERVINHFKKNYQLLSTHSLEYKAPIDKTNLEHLISMTPLSWKVSQERIQQVLHSDIQEISVEFTILLGQKSND
ncbi:23S rRNA m(1)G-748 methyltransferase [Alkalibaculum bacchi]|uniref:23S rRNA m(1)G-748 methyltransferase n=1 Tax=Alkalibaculum bacchi TaxID=645887 RepID=A0A366I956_9FIRM|nr:methyltransferase domain-containing protein [Alkalibaculum bacchi]RBP64495.1 23S rRNA m(1)G-748 methyltransferase [Alkalibaculum bacchi]